MRGALVTSRLCGVQSSPAAVPCERRASTMTVCRATSSREGCWLRLTLKNHVHTSVTLPNGSDERREEGVFTSLHVFFIVSLPLLHKHYPPPFKVHVYHYVLWFSLWRDCCCHCIRGTLSVLTYFLMQLWN